MRVRGAYPPRAVPESTTEGTESGEIGPGADDTVRLGELPLHSTQMDQEV